MDGPQPGSPRIDVLPLPPPAPVGPGRWRCAWAVRNRSSAPLRVLAAWLPHGRFRAERVAYPEPMLIGPDEAREVGFEVACQEAPGAEVENCFVILVVEAGGRPWRVFARLTVRVGEDGAPEPRTELVTVHPATLPA